MTMMTTAQLPDCPALAGDYLIDGRHYCRVTVTRSGSRDGYVSYHAQAWLVDASGAFAVGSDGVPIRTPGSDHTINLSALASRTATRDPGWVKCIDTDVDPDALPPGWRDGAGEPDADGETGAHYYDRQAQQAWAWSAGELDRIRRGKAEQLAHILVLRDLDEAMP